jgi:hypothetical protein
VTFGHVVLLWTICFLLTRVHFVRTQRDLACAQMKFHKQMRDMRDLLRFKLTYIIYILFINSNELPVLVLFSRSQDFIPGITFKDVLRFEERNKNCFFFNSEGNPRQYLKKIAYLHLVFFWHAYTWPGLCTNEVS